MRKRFFVPGIIFLIFALSIPALLFAQQSRTARRVSTPESTSTANPTAGRETVTGPLIKRDLAEALSVIQSNYIDGRKLDYNSLFKSSINGMLRVLDPHSTYFDPVE